MSSKGLLIAAILLTLLAGGVYWSRRTDEANKDKPAPGASPKLISFNDEDVRRIEIRRKDAPLMVLDKGRDNAWKIAVPEQLNADTDAVGGVLAALNGLTWDQLVEEKPSDAGQYGLAAPSLFVQITAKDGKQSALQVGDESPAGGGFYARLPGDPRVFTIASATRAAIDKSPRELRDKRLLTSVDDKLTKLTLTAKGAVIELSKNAAGDWQITRPRALRADGGQVENLIQKLRDMRMDTSASEEDLAKAPANFAGGSRVATAAVTGPAGTQQAEIRKKGDEYFARSSAVEGTWKITGDAAQGLDKSLDDLRNKKLFDFAFNDPGRVEIRSAGKSYEFQKSGEQWKGNGSPADPTAVQNLVDKLRDLSAASFPPYGPSAPDVEVTVVWDSGKRTEKVILSKGTKLYTGRREGEPSLYGIEPKAVDDILHAAENVKAPVPPKQEPVRK